MSKSRCRKGLGGGVSSFSLLLLGFSRFGGKLVKTSIPNNNSRKQAAFTLAEVIITLGIIGVVAAMTLPTVVNKVQKAVIKSQFRKAYSTISQAYIKAQVDLGYKPMCAYGLQNIISDCDAFRQAVENNLKIAKICENKALTNGCLPESSYRSGDTIYQENHPDNTNENFYSANCGGFNKSNIDNNSRVLVLNDGTIVIYYGHPNSGLGALIAIDVNGKKKPNKWGYDIFGFTANADSKKPIHLVPSNSRACAPVEKGGMSSYDFIQKL